MHVPALATKKLAGLAPVNDALSTVVGEPPVFVTVTGGFAFLVKPVRTKPKLTDDEDRLSAAGATAVVAVPVSGTFTNAAPPNASVALFAPTLVGANVTCSVQF
jgi:ketopantoate hydroxymethyltransferase